MTAFDRTNQTINSKFDCRRTRSSVFRVTLLAVTNPSEVQVPALKSGVFLTDGFRNNEHVVHIIRQGPNLDNLPPTDCL